MVIFICKDAGIIRGRAGAEHETKVLNVKPQVGYGMAALNSEPCNRIPCACSLTNTVERNTHIHTHTHSFCFSSASSPGWFQNYIFRSNLPYSCWHRCCLMFAAIRSLSIVGQSQRTSSIVVFFRTLTQQLDHCTAACQWIITAWAYAHATKW